MPTAVRVARAGKTATSGRPAGIVTIVDPVTIADLGEAGMIAVRARSVAHAEAVTRLAERFVRPARRRPRPVARPR